jgi:membrane-anchored glycerophosphoryl diester phosphodiesterase (GDPDase)
MNKTINLDATEAVKFSWEKFKANWQTLTAVSIVMMLVSGLVTLSQYLIESPYTPEYGMPMVGAPLGVVVGSSVLTFLSVIVSLWFGYNATKISFRILDNKKVQLNDLFASVGQNFWRWFGANLLVGLGAGVLMAAFVFAGFALVGLVGNQGALMITAIPALIILAIAVLAWYVLRYVFAANLIIDKDMKVMEALNTSVHMSEGIKLRLVGFFIAITLFTLLIMIAGVIALLVGVIPAAIISTWITNISVVKIYRQVYAHKFGLEDKIVENVIA